MPTPFVADAADEAVRSNSILNERKAADIIEETALEVDIRAWRADACACSKATTRENVAARCPSSRSTATSALGYRGLLTRMSRTEVERPRSAEEPKVRGVLKGDCRQGPRQGIRQRLY